MDKLCCTKCGHSLVLEAIGNYGDVYHVRQNGYVGHKIRRLMYEYSGDEMLYCPGCGESYEFRYDSAGRIVLCE